MRTASKHAIILFFIGPCNGEVLRDVLPINACHLFLNKPWLFDNYVLYDRHANTYTLKHKGHSHVLAPLPLPKPHKI